MEEMWTFTSPGNPFFSEITRFSDMNSCSGKAGIFFGQTGDFSVEGNSNVGSVHRYAAPCGAFVKASIDVIYQIARHPFASGDDTVHHL